MKNQKLLSYTILLALTGTLVMGCGARRSRTLAKPAAKTPVAPFTKTELTPAQKLAQAFPDVDMSKPENNELAGEIKGISASEIGGPEARVMVVMGKMEMGQTCETLKADIKMPEGSKVASVENSPADNATSVVVGQERAVMDVVCLGDEKDACKEMGLLITVRTPSGDTVKEAQTTVYLSDNAPVEPAKDEKEYQDPADNGVYQATVNGKSVPNASVYKEENCR